MYVDYLDLKLDVGETTGRRDVSDVMDMLTKRAETKLNRKLRLVQMLTNATVTMVDGVGTLPADFIEPYQVRNGVNCYPQASTEGVQTFNIYEYATNRTQLLLGNFSGDLQLSYYAKIPTITDQITNPSNWLLEDGPDVYLYAIGAEVAQHVRDSDLRNLMNSELVSAMKEMRKANYRHQWGDAVVKLPGITP